MDNRQATPLLSICIPAYNAAPLLRQCLESVCIQQFRDFEVIITDDSTDGQTALLAEAYGSRLPIRYEHHEKAHGSPGNWNSSLSLARGELVMVLHQDDRLTHDLSLTHFTESFQYDPGLEFAFGKITPEETEDKVRKFPALISRLGVYPEIILMQNIIGPPSNVMFRNRSEHRFDDKLIWVVDYELYFRWLKDGRKFRYIPEKLVEIGLHEEQITSKLRTRPDLKLREEISLLGKHRARIRMTWQLYDHYWRGVRNTRIVIGDERMAAIMETGCSPFTDIWRAQQKHKAAFFQNGAVSKIMMTFSWMGHKFKN